MYLLTRNSLTRGEWFQPDSQSLNWTERESSSSITLGREDVPEISLGDWVLDEDGPAGATVWRVKTIDDQTNAETVTIELEHILQTLEDVSLFGTTTAADMGGGTTVSAETAARWVLNHQSDWVLGDFSHSVSMAYEFNGETLLDALETISGTLTNPQWEYDLTSYPFTLHIRVRTDTVTSEMRGGRNLTSLRKSVSRSGMFTRIYPIGKNDLHLTGGYLSKNEAIYGRIDKIQTESSIGDEAMLQAWAQGMLDRHAEPIVTVTINGFEYKQETGEDLDQVKLNAGCRVPLPEYGTVITERIVRVQWRDKIKEPDVVTITLANNQDDVSRILKENRKSSGKSARGQAKQNYLFEANGEHLLYEVFDECGYLHGILRMTEQSLRIAFDNEIESLHSEFTMTAQSLRIAFTNEIASTRSEFRMTAESLRISFENEASSLRSGLEMEAGRIGLVVEGYGTSASIKLSAITDGINNDSTLELNADRIYVGSGSSKKTVKVYVDGQISATSAEITNLKTGTTKATLINSDALVGDAVTGGIVYATTQLSIGSGSQGGSGTLYYRGTQFYNQALTLGSNGAIASGNFLGNSSMALSLDHYHQIVAEEGTGADAGKIFLTLSDPVATSDSSRHITNFNIADTTAYKNGVLSARNNVKVKAFTADARVTLNDHRTFTYTTDAPTPASGVPQADTWYLAQGSWSSNKLVVSLRYGSSGGTSYAQTEVDASTLVTNAGYAGRAAVTLQDPTWNSSSGTLPSSRTVTVSTTGRTNSSGTTSNLSKSVALYLTQGSWSSNKLVVSMRTGSTSGTAYAQTTVDASTLVTNAGYAGRAAVTLNDPTWNAISGDIGTSRTVTVSTTGRTNSSGTTSNLSKDIALSLTSSGSTVYMQYGGTSYAKCTVTLSWSYSDAISTSSSEPSGTFAKSYSMSKSYAWGKFSVTVNGVTKNFKIHLL